MPERSWSIAIVRVDWLRSSRRGMIPPALLLLYILHDLVVCSGDSCPVSGSADDVVVVVFVLRAVAREAGHGPLERLWPESLTGPP